MDVILKKRLSISFICSLGFVLFCVQVNAKDNLLTGSMEASGSYSTPGSIPFWFRSNQFGSIPLDRTSTSLTGGFHKDYNTTNPHLVDWGIGLEGRANLGYRTNYSLIEGYAKVKLAMFELKGGRSKEIMGLCDTSLTSGAWTLSGTALGVPEIQLCIPEFYTLPFLGRLFALKGNFVHGWIGDANTSHSGKIDSIKTYLHQKSLYGRFGKPEWRLKFYGGFNHNVYWGNEKEIFGESYNLSKKETYWKVLSGGSWSSSRLGNQLGSIDLGLEYRFNSFSMFAYHLFVYDAGALAYLANIRDGLNGLSIKNLNDKNQAIQWKKILFEFLYTKNQAGETWSKFTPSGDEDYFNNGIYSDGWSYQGKSLGNPFISPKNLTRTDLPCATQDFFNNNRVILFHLGLEGIIYNYRIQIKTSYSLNYGTYATSETGRSMGGVYHHANIGLFGEQKQFSGYLSVSRELKQGFSINLKTALDQGQLYYNSYGVMLGAKKTF